MPILIEDFYLFLQQQRTGSVVLVGQEVRLHAALWKRYQG